MTPSRTLIPILLGFVVLLAAAESCTCARAGDEPADSVIVLCEAWRVTNTAVLAEVEALTERDPSAASAVRDLLRSKGDSAQRLTRMLTPAADGKELLLDDMRREAVAAPVTTTGGAVAGGFGGFVESGAKLQLICYRTADRVTIDLDVRIQWSDKPQKPAAGAPYVPPGQTSTQLRAAVAAPIGAMRMYTSTSGDDAAVFVFVRATEPDAKPEAATTSTTGDFSDAEIARFRALKKVVDDLERKERTLQMTARQLERAGLELTEAQTEAVVAQTATYRESVRALMMEFGREGAGTEEFQARMEALKMAYEDGLKTTLDEETAAKVVEAMARPMGRGFGGSGRRGPR